MYSNLITYNTICHIIYIYNIISHIICQQNYLSIKTTNLFFKLSLSGSCIKRLQENIKQKVEKNEKPIM